VRTYDPNQAPDAEQWLALDPQRRAGLIEKFHRRAREKIPSIKAHALFHAIVENQIAMQHPPALRAMQRLAKQGLSRHDCIHAIGWVVARYVHTIVSTTDSDALTSDFGAQCDAAVERLTAAGWLAQIEE
jgi:hypothetical protein